MTLQPKVNEFGCCVFCPKIVVNCSRNSMMLAQKKSPRHSCAESHDRRGDELLISYDLGLIKPFHHSLNGSGLPMLPFGTCIFKRLQMVGAMSLMVAS